MFFDYSFIELIPQTKFKRCGVFSKLHERVDIFQLRVKMYVNIDTLARAKSFKIAPGNLGDAQGIVPLCNLLRTSSDSRCCTEVLQLPSTVRQNPRPGDAYTYMLKLAFSCNFLLKRIELFSTLIIFFCFRMKASYLTNFYSWLFCLEVMDNASRR